MIENNVYFFLIYSHMNHSVSSTYSCSLAHHELHHVCPYHVPGLSAVYDSPASTSPHSPLTLLPLLSSYPTSFPSSRRPSPAIPSKEYTSYCDDPVCLPPGKTTSTRAPLTVKPHRLFFPLTLTKTCLWKKQCKYSAACWACVQFYSF